MFLMLEQVAALQKIRIRELAHWLLLGLLLPMSCASCSTLSEASPSTHAPVSGTVSTRSIPGGITCLLRLTRHAVAHQPLAKLAHVNTPVRVHSDIGGVVYRPTGRRPFEGDCRLVVALWRAAPLLRSLGIQEVHYSNVYRRSGRGARRLSRHTLGLAIDIHRIRFCQGKVCRLLRVDPHFETGLVDACENPSRPLLNRVACLLRRRGYFDRVLTPDTDAAHRNHFHLALLSFERRRFSTSRRRKRPVITD